MSHRCVVVLSDDFMTSDERRMCKWVIITSTYMTLGRDASNRVSQYDSRFS